MIQLVVDEIEGADRLSWSPVIILTTLYAHNITRSPDIALPPIVYQSIHRYMQCDVIASELERHCRAFP
jgi:hypothetical protein